MRVAGVEHRPAFGARAGAGAMAEDGGRVFHGGRAMRRSHGTSKRLLTRERCEPMILLPSATPDESWRGVRAAEGAGLENQCGALRHRGFESHPLRCLQPAPRKREPARLTGGGSFVVAAARAAVAAVVGVLGRFGSRFPQAWRAASRAACPRHPPRISCLPGANRNWLRYGIAFRRRGRRVGCGVSEQ